MFVNLNLHHLVVIVRFIAYFLHSKFTRDVEKERKEMCVSCNSILFRKNLSMKWLSVNYSFLDKFSVFILVLFFFSMKLVSVQTVYIVGSV